MKQIKHYIIRGEITGNEQIIRFSKTLPNNLLVCTGIKISTGYMRNPRWYGYQSSHSAEQFSAGYCAIEFDKREVTNIPVLSSFDKLDNNEFFLLNEPLDNTLVTGYYRDNGVAPLPYMFTIYFRCTCKWIR